MTPSVALPLIPAGLLALAVFYLSYGWLEGVVHILARLRGARRIRGPLLANYLTSLAGRKAGQSTPAGEPLADVVLYGVPAQMSGWMLVSAAAGLAMTWSLFPFQPAMQPVGAVAAVAPLIWRRMRVRRGEGAMAVQVRALLDDLRLSLALDVAIGPALERIAGEEQAGVLYRRLRFHVERMSAYASSVDVLRLLAVELRSRDLADLVRRLEAARRGGESYRMALEAAADELVERMNAQAEQALEAAPMQLMLPMLALLFPPALVLTLYPLADRLIKQIAGGSTL